jgi:beta-aspartyl-peptidase (threonine type)
MDGHGPRAGAVAAVRHVKNPVELARLVMEKSPHVLMVGDGAEEFALEQGVVLVPRSYFRTRQRITQLEEEKRAQEGRAPAPAPQGKGTVGAVALDRDGNLAAATSTGGLSNKHRGRVGDSPIIGAGTYASNETCAISGTGDGEYFIRGVIAYDICALVQYKHEPLQQAVNEVIHGKLTSAGGEGGVIAVDPAGDIVMDFNSVGMFRAARDAHGRREIAIYRDQ